MGGVKPAGRTVCAAVLAVALGACCRFPFTGSGDELTLLSYNVQNLCDDVDHGVEYPEYDPGGDYWNTRLFHRRLLLLARTLRSHPKGGADVILLQEVENENVLRQLREHYLHGGGYRYSIVTSIPDSPINLGCLSRLPLKEMRVHAVRVDGEPAGRPLAELTIDCGRRRLRLLHCHWKSKAGGAQETEELRRAAAAVAGRRVREITACDPRAEVIIAGDLNENADEWRRVAGAYPTALMSLPVPAQGSAAAAAGVTAGSAPAAGDEPLAGSWGTFASLPITGDIELWRAARKEVENQPPAERAAGQIPLLFSPWLSGSMGGEGSYYYNGQWETIDHFLLSPALGDGRGLEYVECRVVQDRELLGESGTPLRWITRTEAGCSDHLPLLLRLRMERR